MVIRQHGLEGDSYQHNKFKFAGEFRARIARKSEINAPAPQSLHLLPRRHLAKHDFDFRAALSEGPQCRSQCAGQHRRYIADGQRAPGLGPKRSHFLYRLIAATEQVAGVGKKSLAGGSELETRVSPVEQWHAQLLFQVAQLTAHRRLNAQTRRGAAHVQFFRNSHEITQVPEFPSIQV